MKPSTDALPDQSTCFLTTYRPPQTARCDTLGGALTSECEILQPWDSPQGEIKSVSRPYSSVITAGAQERDRSYRTSTVVSGEKAQGRLLQSHICEGSRGQKVQERVRQQFQIKQSSGGWKRWERGTERVAALPEPALCGVGEKDRTYKLYAMGGPGLGKPSHN
ncbi:hypothetical protein NDU88_005503 [Pleurodeles waltl]|uniref:Uncharacterized protein n=1 Tax=Pleurodeles waltl TaxID=8319 RepID=A0AAV7UJ58_PLEWA|nr:hypothetical protein NDU88_005503 [Pleurodeles waltl]